MTSLVASYYKRTSLTAATCVPYVIREAKIHSVVMGISTGEIGGFNSRFPLLTDSTIHKWASPPTVITGVLESECKNV